MKDRPALIINLDMENAVLLAMGFVICREHMKRTRDIDLVEVLKEVADESPYNKKMVKKIKRLMDKLTPAFEKLDNPFWNDN